MVPKKSTRRLTATIPPEFHRHLVLMLMDSAPYGAELRRKLSKVDVESSYPEPHPDALALLDAVELSAALLAEVRELVELPQEKIALVWFGWDGEDAPFVMEDLTPFVCLPNLERFVFSGHAAFPVDPTPLLSLAKLRYVELDTWDYVWTQSGSRKQSNKKAITALQKAGFCVVAASESGTTVLARTLGPG